MASLQPELHSIHPHRAAPFAFARDEEPVPAREPAPFGYVLLKQTSLAPGELERAECAALEVMGFWGSTVLFATHLTPERELTIGESSERAPVDFEMPATELGARSFKLIEQRSGVAHAMIPLGARAVVKQVGESNFTPVEARSVALLHGTTVEIELGQVRFRLANVSAGALTPRAGLKSAEGSVLAAFGTTFGLAAAMLAAVAFWMPALGADDSEDLDHDRLVLMQQYLSAQAERNREEHPNDDESGQKNSQPGAPAEAAAGRMGALGKSGAPVTNHRAAVAGDSAMTQLSRAQAIEAARSFGMIELLGSLSSSGGASSPFARDAALGHDSLDAEGTMWGDTIGESGGNGLGLSGPDNGGGGHGTGVGVGTIGTCGTANCGASGWGHGNSLGQKEHKSGGPRVRMAAGVDVSGHIPAEVVQRIVRQNYGRFRMCYENGLRSNPNLSGRVTTRFAIARDGSVANASNGGSDLADSGVVSCVVSAFYGLSFPAPEVGVVRVSYPITFSPE